MNNIPECTCKFVAIGKPLDNTSCRLHPEKHYRCDMKCDCQDYRPSRVKLHPTDWPTCVCGHIAQEHN